MVVESGMDVILSMIFILFLPVYGYLIKIQSDVSATCERIEAIDYRVRRLEKTEVMKHVSDD